MKDDIVVHVPGLVDSDGDGLVQALWSIRELLSKILLVIDSKGTFDGVQQ